MQTFYTVKVARSGLLAVDCFSVKHAGVCKWRSYYGVTPASVSRLRGLWRPMSGPVWVFKGWSRERTAAYQTHMKRREIGGGRGTSLDYLETSGR